MGQQESVSCPICGGIVDHSVLVNIQLTKRNLEMLDFHIKTGTIGDALSIAEIGMRNLNSDRITAKLENVDYFESTQKRVFDMLDILQKNQAEFLQQIINSDESNRNQLLSEHLKLQENLTENFKRDQVEKMEIIKRTEEERTKEYNTLNNTLKELHEKLFGTTIGTAGEVVTILDLKKVCPADEYSETRSSKHGTDIVAEVIEYGKRCGKISVSVKYQQKWDSDFINQLTRNMFQDQSRWGILVTKVFPREALNTNMWTVRNNSGNLLFLVKPEFAPLAYVASRQIVVYWNSIQTMLQDRNAAKKEEERMKIAVFEWLSGEKFQKTLGDLSNALDMSAEINDGLMSLQNYLVNRIKKLRDSSEQIQSYLELASLALTDLKQTLHKYASVRTIHAPIDTITSKRNGGM